MDIFSYTFHLTNSSFEAGQGSRVYELATLGLFRRKTDLRDISYNVDEP